MGDFMQANRAFLGALGCAALALLTGCSDSSGPVNGGGGGSARTATVLATTDLQFVESEVQMAVNGTVTWRSTSGLRHSVTPVGHDLWEPVEIEGTGVILEQSFPEVGEYEYRCDYHWQQGMVGRIIVLPS
jgi:plastocyanin